MTEFSRGFAADKLAVWHAGHPNSVVAALFDRWALPGEPITNAKPLRLCVRDGYLNFYANGQSVAHLSMANERPTLRVHRKYLLSDPIALEVGSSSGDYVRLSACKLEECTTRFAIDTWIEHARDHADAEKCFVDELVAANEGIIDLEMGLPNFKPSRPRKKVKSDPKRELIAPRMDIVAIEAIDAQNVALVFWEAKCANNSGLRAEGEPDVVGQLFDYREWMALPGHKALVALAYRKVAATLLALYSTFRPDENDGAPSCLTIWQLLADVNACMKVIPEPAVVVSNMLSPAYRATPEKFSVASGRMRQCAISFARNRHRLKLTRPPNQLVVHEVGPLFGDQGDLLAYEGLNILPKLASGEA